MQRYKSSLTFTSKEKPPKVSLHESRIPMLQRFGLKGAVQGSQHRGRQSGVRPHDRKGYFRWKHLTLGCICKDRGPHRRRTTFVTRHRGVSPSRCQGTLQGIARRLFHDLDSLKEVVRRVVPRYFAQGLRSPPSLQLRARGS